MDRHFPRLALLCQLDPSLQAELSTALSDPALDVSTDTCSELEECCDKTRSHSPDILFCPLSADLADFVSSLDQEIPVIVVSRVPDTVEWIDAMEAGACDYCAPPFELSQLRWMLSAAGRGSPVLQASA